MSAPVEITLSKTLHRLANSLAILSATIRMERRRVTDPGARAALDGASTRLDAVAQVQRLIYHLPPEARIDLTGFLGHLSPVIGTSLGMGCGVRGASVEVSGRTAERLAVAMVELALNAHKHGHGGAAGDGIEVRVARAPGGWVRLTVRDWGRGLAELAEPFEASGAEPTRGRRTQLEPAGPGSKRAGPDGMAPDGLGPDGCRSGRGLGLRLVGSAVESLGGRMRTVTNGGVHVVIEVPQG